MNMIQKDFLKLNQSTLKINERIFETMINDAFTLVIEYQELLEDYLEKLFNDCFDEFLILTDEEKLEIFSTEETLKNYIMNTRSRLSTNLQNKIKEASIEVELRSIGLKLLKNIVDEHSYVFRYLALPNGRNNKDVQRIKLYQLDMVAKVDNFLKYFKTESSKDFFTKANCAIANWGRKVFTVFCQVRDKYGIENNVKDTILEATVGKPKQEKVFDYKALNKLAEECGFKYARQCGSHAQYINAIGKTVTIPQGRSLGKGLSMKIQKDLKTETLSFS